MKKEMIVVDFNNLEKRYSFRMVEDNNQKMIIAQEKGVLIISYTFDKSQGKIVELGGTLGEQLKKNIPEEEHTTRVEDYARFAVEFYNPDSRTNQMNREYPKISI